MDPASIDYLVEQEEQLRLRPLTDEHLRYARMDTHYLLHIYDLLRQALIEIFEEDYPNSLEALQTAVSEGDAEKIEATAHSMKSALGNIGANSAFELAKELETCGRESQLDGVGDKYTALVGEIDKYKAEVQQFKSEQ